MTKFGNNSVNLLGSGAIAIYLLNGYFYACIRDLNIFTAECGIIKHACAVYSIVGVGHLNGFIINQARPT
jgi:hypothetical protein